MASTSTKSSTERIQERLRPQPAHGLHTSSGVGNAFIAEFIAPNAHRLAELYSMNSAIEAERSAWMSSGAAEQIVDRLAAVLPHVMQERDNYIRYEALVLYGDTGASSGSTRKAANWFDAAIMPQLPRNVKEAVTEIMGIEREHAANYEKAIGALEEQRDSLFFGISESWKVFMASSHSHLSEFYSFLTLGEFAQAREEHRVFLQLLERHRRAPQGRHDVLGAIKDTLIAEELSKPHEDPFGAFLLHLILKSERRATGSTAHSDIKAALEWMELISFPSQGIDVPAVLSAIVDSGIFPSQLRRMYASYLDSDFTMKFEAARRALSAYKREDASVPSITTDLRTTRRREGPGRRAVFTTSLEVTMGSLPEASRQQQHRLLLYGNHEDSHAALADFVSDAVRKISPNDSATEADLFRIISTLAEDPRGLGASMISRSHSVLSPYSGRKVPLWHYRADKRPGVNFENPNSRKLRAMYFFDPTMANTVVLQSVLTHDQFDMKYQ